MSNGIYYFYLANLNVKHSLVVSLRGGNVFLYGLSELQTLPGSKSLWWSFLL